MEYVEWFVLYMLVVNFFVRLFLTVFQYRKMELVYAWASEPDLEEEIASDTKFQPELASQCMLPEIVVEKRKLEKMKQDVQMRNKKKMAVAMMCMTVLLITSISVFFSPVQIMKTFSSASAVDGLQMRQTNNAVTTRVTDVCYVIKNFDDFKNVFGILYENYLQGNTEEIQLFTEEADRFVNISLRFEKPSSEISVPATGGEMDAMKSTYSDAEYFDVSDSFISSSTSTDADSLNMVNDGYLDETMSTFLAYLEQLISYCNDTTREQFPYAYLVVILILFLLIEYYMYFCY